MEGYLLGILIVILIFLGLWFYKRKYGNLSKSSDKVIGEENNNTSVIEQELFSIREINNEVALQPEHYNELSTSKELNNNISMLLKELPRSVGDVVKKQETSYLLTFSEKTAKAINEGKLELMQVKNNLGGVRAQAVNPKGRVVEHGILKPSNINRINPTQLAMGVLTTFTAQEHLQQIGNQLRKINNDINILISAIDNKQIGNDKGNIDYLKTIFTSLNKSDYSNENIRDYRQQLETIIRNTMQDLSTIEEGLPDYNLQLENEKLKGLWAATKETENITEIINNYEKQCSIYLSKLDVILVCLSLSKHLNPNYSADNSRLDYVNMKLDHLEKNKRIFFKKVEEILPEIGARIRYRREQYNSNIQKRIEKQATNLSTYFDNSKEDFALRIKKTKNGEFFDDTFEDGAAKYKITIDENEIVKSVKKVEQKSDKK
ncbi:hypothetical protein QRD89_18825 [Halobacillus sp. ACCC02827]|uniref:hypothetical protein n=1 Tax=Halobacillus sp. ACCC02827 TaxID=3052090 RepID=UPI00257046E0|nr:hypothetical protein [Halobacillus sp. ACCC02827]WJE15750.1 hypothetical protein QRD89_18825 [Halobacillus sp. ACCC02827]